MCRLSWRLGKKSVLARLSKKSGNIPSSFMFTTTLTYKPLYPYNKKAQLSLTNSALVTRSFYINGTV